MHEMLAKLQMIDDALRGQWKREGSACKTDAFLDRATSAVSTSVRIRTPSSSFGGCPLSQEHHSCNAAEPSGKNSAATGLLSFTSPAQQSWPNW